MNLKNKVAIVTGAASGIGLATAETLAAAGAAVAVGDIARENGEKAELNLRARGFDARFFYLDVTCGNSIESFKQAVLAWHSQVDIVVNVAGWGKIQPFVENTPEFWRQVVDLNLMGPIAVTRAFLDGMMERNYGKVVVVASDAGRVGSLGETVYAAAKGGAIAFTKSLAREMARYSINVNSICPGPTDTPLFATVTAENPKLAESLKRVIPFGRLGQPEDLPPAVIFFASDDAGFITGQTLSVSGGLTMM